MTLAIAKVIFKSSAEDTGTVWMDTTQKTVTSGSMLNGITALKNDGTGITGNIASKTQADVGSVSWTYYNNETSDYIRHNVSVAGGYYEPVANKGFSCNIAYLTDLPKQAAATITPTESEQTAVSKSKWTTGDVKVGAISSTYVGSGVTQNDSDDLTASGATVTAPAGYYTEDATKTIASGTEGTPTATKGTVSNHSISVTPSVTNSAGYISGGTHSGTAATVSASELVSGTKSITSSGTTDVTNYESVSVAAGSATISNYEAAQSTPSISIDSSTGVITATNAQRVIGAVNFGKNVTSGYIASVSVITAPSVTLTEKSATQGLSTQSATTITPSTSSQTAVAAGKYTTGAAKS